MADRVADWVSLVDGAYPEGDAESWDVVGLQVGDPATEIEAVLVCLDVTEATLDEAAEAGAGLILAHHPLLFRPLQRLTPETAAGRLALRAAAAGTAILAAHTNFDRAANGTSDPTVRIVGLHDVTLLAPMPTASVKLVTFVPAEAAAGVLAALSGAGAGIIGEYDHCSFRLSGTGTFRPSAAADPAVGERWRLNEVDEERLEMVLPEEHVGAALAALVAAHPYEEVAYDLYPLVGAGQRRADKGVGRIGHLPQPQTVAAIADRLAQHLPSPHLRIAGDPARQVSRVAVCGGAGDSYIEAAGSAGAELYITGDLRHHVALDALTMGLTLIDAGHYATEAAALPALCDELASGARARDLTARLLASTIRTEPWGPGHWPRPGSWGLHRAGPSG